jgi:predicted acyl esterase
VLPWGISYLASTAEFTVAQMHPAVKAACIHHVINWDIYATIYPGGVFCKLFVEAWSMGGKLQDQMKGLDEMIAAHPEMAFILRLVSGVKPVDKTRIKEAIQQHVGNHYISEYLHAGYARDDPVQVPGKEKGDVRLVDGKVRLLTEG